MLDNVLQKLYILPKRIFTFFGAPPYRYWGVFLLICVAVFLGIIVFDFSVYWDTKTRGAHTIFQGSKEDFTRVDEKALARVSETLRMKEKRFEEILQAPPYEDPSL